jgi:energy-coupling factor transport system ATP-binding protein
MISFHELTYTYPNRVEPALLKVNWQAQAGEMILLSGPSGSGKSTLLRCLNGLVPHFTGGMISGQVLVDGLDVMAAGPQIMSQHVGFVSQSPEAQAVLDEVEAEIAFALENMAVPPQEMRVRVEEVLDLLDLAPLRHRSLATLSGGERQRVVIAAALALRPNVLVLDEPTSQLDPQSADDVLRSLVRLNEDLGLTIILAEHRLERVLRYIDRLSYLENGQITADGPAREVLATISGVPPLLELARALNWRPLPLTVKEGRRFTTSFGPWMNTDHHGFLPDSMPSSEDSVETPLLAAERLRFAYNGHPALKEVSVRVHPGETVAVLGRNGSGKTTLLKCVIGLLTQQEGEVWINGHSTSGRSVAEISREVAYLPQNPDDLLFAESVADEMALTLHNHGIRQSRYSLDPLLNALGLTSVADIYPRDLSVGQRQRVAFGAVAVTRPRLLLLDEPTRGVDPAAKKTLVAIWQRWLREGAGLLLVTHDVELAALIADRVLIMSQGEIIASGETAEVLSASPHFAPQIARLFPGRGWLTVNDALAGLRVGRE